MVRDQDESLPDLGAPLGLSRGSGYRDAPLALELTHLDNTRVSSVASRFHGSIEARLPVSEP